MELGGFVWIIGHWMQLRSRINFQFPQLMSSWMNLGGATVFSKLDLRAGYHQIRVHNRDTYKTTFRTHDTTLNFCYLFLHTWPSLLVFAVAGYVLNTVLAPLLGLPLNTQAASEAKKVLVSSLPTIENIWLKRDGQFLLGSFRPSIADLSLVWGLGSSYKYLHAMIHEGIFLLRFFSEFKENKL